MNIPLFLSACLVVASAICDPVQYCRYGFHEDKVDFCIAMTTHYNDSTASHDFYLVLQVTRASSSGWTAVGTGPEMAGSLMFFVYGDPASSQLPTLSIRTTDQHNPHLITSSDTGDTAIRVLHTSWLPPSAASSPGLPRSSQLPAHTAQVAAICYSCTLWPGTPISVAASSYPWIWAWNPDQDLHSYNADARLVGHHGTGGYGHFYVNMPQSTQQTAGSEIPELPVIQPGIEAVGASERPTDGDQPESLRAESRTVRLAYIHGSLMGIAFLILCPLGTIAIRAGHSEAFKHHWILQTTASLVAVSGGALGLLASGRKPLATPHQSLGLLTLTLLAFQPLLGWGHHMMFLRVRRRTWLARLHMAIGWLIKLGSWYNLLDGVARAGHGQTTMSVAVTGVVVGFLVVTIVTWVGRKRSQSLRSQGQVPRGSSGQSDAGQEYSPLNMENDRASGDESEVEKP